MPRDHLVRQRSHEQISACAGQLRAIAGMDTDDRLDVITLLHWLEVHELSGKGRLKIYQISTRDGESPAWVKFNPLRLYVDKGLWEDAKIGEPKSRYILALEVGHILLHDNDAKAFPVASIQYNIFGIDDISAEKQADYFSDCLMMPEHILLHFLTPEDAASHCGLEIKVVKRQWPKRERLITSLKKYTGDTCRECQSFTMVSDGMCLKCEKCGSTTGCN